MPLTWIWWHMEVVPWMPFGLLSLPARPNLAGLVEVLLGCQQGFQLEEEEGVLLKCCFWGKQLCNFIVPVLERAGLSVPSIKSLSEEGRAFVTHWEGQVGVCKLG